MPKSAIFGRTELDSLELVQPDMDSSALVIPGKKHELRRSMEGHKQGVVGLREKHVPGKTKWRGARCCH